MKKIVFILLLFTAVLHSQENKYERIRALKTAYITEKLALTPSEAEKFWPVYNSFELKFRDLRQRKNAEISDQLITGAENLNNEEANRLIDSYLSIEASYANLQRQKVDALRNIISPQKIIALKKTEDDFKQELLRRYREGKGKRNTSENRKNKDKK